MIDTTFFTDKVTGHTPRVSTKAAHESLEFLSDALRMLHSHQIIDDTHNEDLQKCIEKIWLNLNQKQNG